jgi:hypothetical protein
MIVQNTKRNQIKKPDKPRQYYGAVDSTLASHPEFIRYVFSLGGGAACLTAHPQKVVVGNPLVGWPVLTINKGEGRA